MAEVSFKIKTAFILLVLLCWGTAISCQVFKFTVVNREDLLKRAGEIAWREAALPAKRGRIIDRNGKVLAYDVFCIDLILQRRSSGTAEKSLKKCLKEFAPEIKIELREIPYFPMVLRSHLSPEDAVQARKIFCKHKEVRLVSYYERCVLPGLSGIIGKTSRNDREETVGTSGLEKKYDLELSGRPGRIVVMLDRYGNWIYDTLRILRQPQNGADRILSYTSEELLHGNPKENL